MHKKWIEISKEALIHNLKLIRGIVGEKMLICPAVKANAYGHGISLSAKVFLEAGANWLAVDSIEEAEKLRSDGIKAPIYVMGYVMQEDLEKVVSLDTKIVIYNEEHVTALADLALKKGKIVDLHLKIETGNNRQGLKDEKLINLAKLIVGFPSLRIEGAATHFADIEDTTDHKYALSQIREFEKQIELLKNNGIEVPIRHAANSAATLLFHKFFKEEDFEMVRPGISCYGMWPSKETYVSYLLSEKHELVLQPAFSFKTRIAQIKKVPAHEYIGYGRTYKTTRDSKIGILPVGYYDGYDRKLGNTGYVLINGKRAPIRGRICMNITMVDLTDIPDVALEDEVTLIGKNGEEQITTDKIAEWVGTINYEIPTRINENIPRILTLGVR